MNNLESNGLAPSFTIGRLVALLFATFFVISIVLTILLIIVNPHSPHAGWALVYVIFATIFGCGISFPLAFPNVVK